MTLISHRTVRNVYGAGRTVVKIRCDGPDCGRTIESEPAEIFATWGSMDGFIPPEPSEEPGWRADWCSVDCMKRWAAALPDVPSPVIERHGWVTPLRGGTIRAKCGGPALCSTCYAEQVVMDEVIEAVRQSLNEESEQS